MLEDQRDGLLRRLDELEAEHEAGELGHEDFDALHDATTVEAAAVLRRLDGQVARDQRRSGRVRRLRSASAAGVVVAGVVAGVVVARTAGERVDGQTITGEQIERSSTALLAQAQAELSAGEVLGALELIDEVLERNPDDADALALRGQILVGLPEPELIAGGIAALDRALALDPDHPEALLFRGLAHRSVGELAEAVVLYERLLTVEDMPMPLEVVEGLISDIEAEIAAAGG